MAYAKFDDGFADHPKVRNLSDAAYRMHSSGILHCARWLTDGLITREVLPDLLRRSGVKKRDRALAELLASGLWREHASELGAVYEIHDYLDWNDSRAQVEHRRERNADRLRKWREQNGKGESA